MPVVLRLARFGHTHRPYYRIVATNKRSPRDGKFLEILGTWDPILNKLGAKTLRLQSDRVRYWLGVGAQPSETVADLLALAEIIPYPPKNLSGKNKKKSEEAEN
jgi:small subunit ribosomal protein S16